MPYPVLAKVTYWDEVNGKHCTRVNLLSAYSFSEAAQQLESYYGDCLEDMKLTIYEEGLITMPTHMYKTLKEIMTNGVNEDE